MKSILLACVLIGGVAIGDAAAQGRGRAGGAAPTKPVKTTPVRVTVHDAGGESLEGVKVVLSGDGTGDFTTAGAGLVILPALKDGNYRIHLERQGFLTLEREFAVKNGEPATIDVSLSPAPPPPAPPPPPPAPVKKMPPPGQAVTLSVIDFLEHNFIGKDPLKESVIACTPFETVRLLQVRQPIASHSHDEVDEIVYVVAGEGTFRLGDKDVPLKPGTLVVVPRTSAHAFERKGSNPLMVMSTLSGAPCQETVDTR